MKTINIGFAGIILGTILSILPLRIPFNGHIFVVEAPLLTNGQILELEEKTSLGGILEDLGVCESSNREDVVIIDSNGYKSYGKYQFQLYTFMEFGKKYDFLPLDITEVQAREAIMDNELQEKIAFNMLKDGLWKHWKNCLKNYYE